MGRTLTVAREPLLVVVLGPTASGKTALSLALASRFGGEIVNCDSVAMYREFEIGTAKPTVEERQRAPHHLLDFVDPLGHVTAGEYARLGREAIVQISERRHLPIVAGGTGLYLRALLEGLFAGPERSEELRERLRARAREKGPAHLQAVLERLDGAAAAKIHGNDVPKMIRAIEVCLAARRPMSEMWERGRDPLTGFRVVRLGLNPERAALYARINRRAQGMFDAGLMEETRALVEKYGERPWALNALGYRQAVQCLKGELDLEAAIAAAQQGHRNYAKRQMTWFRREPGVEWIEGFGDEEEIQRQAIGMVSAAA